MRIARSCVLFFAAAAATADSFQPSASAGLHYRISSSSSSSRSTSSRRWVRTSPIMAMSGGSSATTKTWKPPKTQADYAAALREGAPITSDDVSVLPRPGSNAPTSVRFVADGSSVVSSCNEGSELNHRATRLSSIGSHFGWIIFDCTAFFWASAIE